MKVFFLTLLIFVYSYFSPRVVWYRMLLIKNKMHNHWIRCGIDALRYYNAKMDEEIRKLKKKNSELENSRDSQ